MTRLIDRVRHRCRAINPDAYLVGYDVSEIQAFVTAASRPIIMRGASETILGFDKQEEKRSIFAGGGRGIQMSTSTRVLSASTGTPAAVWFR